MKNKHLHSKSVGLTDYLVLTQLFIYEYLTAGFGVKIILDGKQNEHFQVHVELASYKKLPSLISQH